MSRGRLRSGDHARARLRRLKADAPERAVAIVLQQHHRRLLEIEIAAACAQGAAPRHTLDNGHAIQPLHGQPVALSQSLRVNTGDGDVVLKRVNSVPDTINVAFVGATTVRFNSQGFAVAGSSGTMRFCDERGDTYGRALNISATGRVSVATDTDSSPDGIVDDAAGTNIDCP